MFDSKQKPGVSFALWIPLIWYFLAASLNVSRWLDLGKIQHTRGVDYLTGSPIDRMVYIILIAIGLFILFSRKVDWPRMLRNNVLILILFSYMGFSILWSDFQEVSLKRWIRTVGDLVMALVVVTELNPLEAISTLLRRCFYIFLPMSIIFIKYYRDFGVGWDFTGTEMWMGITSHKNVLGEVVMISGVYYVWNIMRNWGSKIVIIDILFLLMTLFLLKGSGENTSKTAMIAFGFGLFLLLGFHFMRSDLRLLKKFIMVIVIFLIVLIFVAFQSAIGQLGQGSIVSSIVGAVGRDITFTGRTLLWADFLDYAYDHPLLGVGYGSFWIGDMANNLWEKHIWKPASGHSGYIDVFVELGIIGLFLLFSMIFIAFKHIYRTIVFNSEYGRFKMTLLLMILFHNVFETSFVKGTQSLWFLLLFLIIDVPNTYKLYNLKRTQICYV